MTVESRGINRFADKVLSVVLGLVVVSIVFSLFSQQLIERNWGWCIVSGESMSPTLDSGDLVFVVPYLPGCSVSPSVGDIIAFEGDSGSVIHRIVDNSAASFITKGDNNAATDQDAGKPAVSLSSLHGTASTIGGRPLRVPMLGEVALELVANGLRLPLICACVAVSTVLLLKGKRGGASNSRGRAVVSSRRAILTKYAILTALGVVVLMSILVRSSSTVDLCYAISDSADESFAASGGMDLGTVEVGDTLVHDFHVVSDFPITMTGLIIERDDCLSVLETPLTIPRNGEVRTSVVLDGGSGNVGIHTSALTMVVFPSVIPSGPMDALASVHVLLAMFAAACIVVLALSIPGGLVEYLLLAGRGSDVRAERRHRLRAVYKE